MAEGAGDVWVDRFMPVRSSTGAGVLTDEVHALSKAMAKALKTRGRKGKSKVIGF
jgi:hypothetical protein